MIRLAGIYAIVNEGAADPVEIARAALAGGVRVVQYRAKSGIVPENAAAIRGLCKAHNVLSIMNDHVEAALEYEFDGVHLGPDDDGFTHMATVRARIGKTRIVGLSCGTEDEARGAQVAGADYIGVGAVYATASKADAGTPIGIEGLRRIAGATSLPVAAIGGISATNLAAVRASGVAMAAVIAAITAAPDPQAAASALVAAWEAIA